MDNVKKTVVAIVAVVIIAALGFLVWRTFSSQPMPSTDGQKKAEAEPGKIPPKEFQELIRKGEVQVQVEKAP